MHLCSRQNKLHICRRLFHDFQQCPPCTSGKHMHFINNINLIGTAFRTVNRTFPQIPNIFYAVIRCRINFNHIGQNSTVSVFADVTFQTRIAVDSVRTVHSFRQNAGTSGFPRSTRTRKQISVCRLSGTHLIL